MKKSLIFAAAASALMLTACSSENDVVQNAPQTQETTAQAVGFDVYTPAATEVTRSGQAGTMTTGRLQRTEGNGGGFGVYAFLVEDEEAGADATSYKTWSRDAAKQKAPNFMVNEKVLWNATNQGWYYNPLKYWPNETNKDSQTTPALMEDLEETVQHLDRLTFFAYAPYVETPVKTEPGIISITDKNGYNNSLTTTRIVEPTIGYQVAIDQPKNAVDLLWGVAPAGGLSYTAVNKEGIYVPEGEPLIDMVKPNVNTNMKFLFQHALARIGINVVAAVDQVGAGGTLDGNTKITVNEVTLTGMFGQTGYLNLDNPTANIANWVLINGSKVNNQTTAVATPTTLTLNVANGTIAPDLCYTGPHTAGSYAAQPVNGVTTSKKDLITGRYFALDEVPAYTPSKTYYSDANGTVAVAKYNAQASDNYYTHTTTGDIYTQVTGDITPAGEYHKVVAGNTFDGTHELTAAVNYTKTSANAYNSANVTGCVATGAAAPADYKTQVGSDPAGATLTEDEAYSYNSTKAGAKTTADVETAATYGYDDTALPTSTVLYTRTGTEGSYVYTYAGTKGDITWDGTAATYCTITPTALAGTDIDFAYTEATIYDVERNYFMVIPTNNYLYKNPAITLNSDEDKALRTIRVKIEYYVTTEDAKVAGGRTQTKNVIEKDVLFPSMANGKSYMLNLVLGLTSVKMDAEVDDWKVINVNADLPQNTDGD